MAHTINIHNIESIKGMSHSLNRFGKESSDSLLRIEQSLNKFIDTIQKKQVAAQRDLENCIENIASAYNAIENCESQEDDDYTPDCTHEYDCLQYERSRKAKAEEELQHIRKWKAKTEQQIDRYRSIAHKIQKVVIQRLYIARQILDSKMVDIEKYLAVSTDTADTFSPGVQVQNNEEVVPYSELITNSITMSGADNNSFSNSTQSNGKWIEPGIKYVDLSHFEKVEDIQDENDFSKVPMADMEAGLRRFIKMQEILSNDKDKTNDYWRDLDHQLGLKYSDGYQRVYDAFYGSEPIRVTKNGNNYTIENGRHRIWLAKKMGIQSLPMSIVEKG